MRLATVLPEGSTDPLAVVAADEKTWLALHDFLTFFGARGLPSRQASMREFLPILMPRFSELTRKVSDWPEHGRIFQQRGGRAVRVSRLLAPVQSPPSVREFCAFEEHFRTLCFRRGVQMAQAWYDVPAFYFSNPNSLVGHEDEVVAPRGVVEFDYELELGIVIGRRARNVPAASAWDCVAGFTIVNDFAARELQRRELAVGFGPAKGSDFATAVGPVLVTRDSFSDRIDGRTLRLEMRARVNGHELSRGNSGNLFHTIPRLIEHASADTDLYPGALIATGAIGGGSILELTPEATNGWLKPGDTIELEIDRIGVLRNRVATP
jgi:fumarylacetoacetate (FAA) hydrolase